MNNSTKPTLSTQPKIQITPNVTVPAISAIPNVSQIKGISGIQNNQNNVPQITPIVQPVNPSMIPNQLPQVIQPPNNNVSQIPKLPQVDVQPIPTILSPRKQPEPSIQVSKIKIQPGVQLPTINNQIPTVSSPQQIPKISKIEIQNNINPPLQPQLPQVDELPSLNKLQPMQNVNPIPTINKVPLQPQLPQLSPQPVNKNNVPPLPNVNPFAPNNNPLLQPQLPQVGKPPIFENNVPQLPNVNPIQNNNPLLQPQVDKPPMFGNNVPQLPKMGNQPNLNFPPQTNINPFPNINNYLPQPNIGNPMIQQQFPDTLPGANYIPQNTNPFAPPGIGMFGNQQAFPQPQMNNPNIPQYMPNQHFPQEQNPLTFSLPTMPQMPTDNIPVVNNNNYYTNPIPTMIPQPNHVNKPNPFARPPKEFIKNVEEMRNDPRYSSTLNKIKSSTNISQENIQKQQEKQLTDEQIQRKEENHKKQLIIIEKEEKRPYKINFNISIDFNRFESLNRFAYQLCNYISAIELVPRQYRPSILFDSSKDRKLLSLKTLQSQFIKACGKRLMICFKTMNDLYCLDIPYFPQDLKHQSQSVHTKYSLNLLFKDREQVHFRLIRKEGNENETDNVNIVSSLMKEGVFGNKDVIYVYHAFTINIQMHVEFDKQLTNFYDIDYPMNMSDEMKKELKDKIKIDQDDSFIFGDIEKQFLTHLVVLSWSE